MGKVLRFLGVLAGVVIAGAWILAFAQTGDCFNELPGCLDASFGVNGRVTVPSGMQVNGIAIQTVAGEERIVVVGETFAMGITLRDIIYKVGGGIPGGKKFKAVQTGGPSGGCIPEKYLDVEVDFDELKKVGAIMGSGGMIVMDEDTCMVDVARYFLNFLTGESCGKCSPCREGIRQMHKILTNISKGKGGEGDIELLVELSEATRDASLCALGGSAPNPVLSTVRYFRDEYEALIKEKRCPAYVCKELVSYHIDPAKCQACMICFKKCPAEAIAGAKNQIHVIDQKKCTKCGTCFEVCPPRFGAVKKISGKPVPPPIPEEARHRGLVFEHRRRGNGGSRRQDGFAGNPVALAHSLNFRRSSGLTRHLIPTHKNLIYRYTI